jgi:sugar fermentation stimulation protein A
MDFESALRSGTLLRRYKRFLADIVTESGEQLTIHCPNPGAMSGCADAGSRVWYSQSHNAARRYPCTLEIVESLQGDLVGVNPARANSIVAEAIRAGRIARMTNVSIHREVPIPGERGRFDFRLDAPGDAAHFVEVKSVTWTRADKLGAFPDAKSERARRHVIALQRMREAGHRASMLFCVQHSGVTRMTIADDVDPGYGAAVRAAQRAGVEVNAYRTMVTPRSLVLVDEIPVEL